MSLTNINSDWMSNASSGLCARAYPPGVAPGAENVTDIYIYTLAHIRPLQCTISSLALRRSATTYRCLREMGTPQYGDPGPHIPSDMGTGEPHITRDVGPWGPQNSGDVGTLQ